MNKPRFDVSMVSMQIDMFSNPTIVEKYLHLLTKIHDRIRLKIVQFDQCFQYVFVYGICIVVNPQFFTSRYIAFQARKISCVAFFVLCLIPLAIWLWINSSNRVIKSPTLICASTTSLPDEGSNSDLSIEGLGRIPWFM